MINKLKNKALLLLILFTPLSTFAQGGGFMDEVKKIINDYMLPILGIGIVIAAGVGLLMNLDDFADRKGEGTRSKALVNIGWIVGVAFVSILAIIAIVNFLGNNQIQVK